MKKRRRSDRKKYQAGPWKKLLSHYPKSYMQHMAMYDRETRWYGQESCLPLPGRVLHVTGNSYQWKKS